MPTGEVLPFASSTSVTPPNDDVVRAKIQVAFGAMTRVRNKSDLRCRLPRERISVHDVAGKKKEIKTERTQSFPYFLFSAVSFRRY